MTNTVNLALAMIDQPRPMKLGLVFAPPLVRVEGDWLISEPGRRTKHKVSRRILSDFLATSESRAAAIRFVKRWGLLGLCSHGIPSAHGRCVARKDYYRESIASVQRFASGLESLLRIGAEMAQSRAGLPEDWKLAESVISGPDFPSWETLGFSALDFGLESARDYLGILMRRLIEICRIRPRFFWNNETGSWQIDLDSERLANNLPALLVLELMITIADKDGYAKCSSCPRTYIPKRRPDPTRRNYCPSCGRTAAVRDASREYRRRLREES